MSINVVTVQSDNHVPPSAQETLAAALGYLRKGFRAIPIPLGEKAPKIEKWGKLRLDEQQLRDVFGPRPSNIGLLTGEASDWLVDVDLDCPEAISAAHELLPKTPVRAGRASKPESHWFYRCAGLETKELFQNNLSNCYSRGEIV
jgi:hypothetical protein